MNAITPIPLRRVRPGTTPPHMRKTCGLLTIMAAGAAALALANHLAARHAERRRRPRSKFMVVDGVRLHYIERGTGSVIVLLHGNGTMADDFEISGITDLLAKNHRVIAFDRPGFGFSERPRNRIWTAQAQADLLGAALHRLKVEHAVVVGHSWGTLVALALALRDQSRVAGLVLMAGYYFPSFRTDIALASWPAVPILGDVLRYTVSPILGRLTSPSVKRKLFAPADVSARFDQGFAVDLAVRPSQLRASAAETALMVPTAAGLAELYAHLTMPVTIIAARDDHIVDFERQALRMSKEVERSALHVVADAGHMLHHTAPDEVADIIEQVARDTPRSMTRGQTTAAPKNPPTVPQDQQRARTVE
jgi:pimeloyl-ACP methyl ester carboxylesterase